MRARKQELCVFGSKKDKSKNLHCGLVNIFWLQLKIMSENNDVFVVKCKYGECCYSLFDYEYVDMSVVRCKYGKSCISPSEVCNEVDSYKSCEMYETMVYMKAEYEKIGVCDMFVG